MRADRLLAILLSLLYAGSAGSNEIVLEGALRGLDLRAASMTRLDMGMDAYRGRDWTGLRNRLRIQRASVASSVWSLSLPWIYSSAAAGLGRRGSLRGGFAWAPPQLGAFRLAGEAWLPFSDDRLAPLQVRRGFLRWSLLGRATFSSQSIRFGLSRTLELRGLIGKEEGEPWTPWNEGEASWSFEGWKRLAPRLAGRFAFRNGDPLWSEAGAGIAFRWPTNWSLELEAVAFFSDQDDPFPTTGLRLLWRRDFADPISEEDASGAEDLAKRAEENASSDRPAEGGSPAEVPGGKDETPPASNP